MLSFAKDARRIKGMSSKRANKCLQTTYKTAPILAAEEQLPACLPDKSERPLFAALRSSKTQ